MAPNSLYPSYLKMFYAVAGSQHTQTIPVKAFLGAGNVWFMEDKTGFTGAPLQTKLDAYTDLLRPIMPTTADMQFAELWTLASPTATPEFQEVFQINKEGTRAGTNITMTQEIITFRTQGGGRYKWTLMDCVGLLNEEVYPPFTGTRGALATYLTGGSGWICGRNGGWLIQPIRYLTKTNDHLRKKRLLEN